MTLALHIAMRLTSLLSALLAFPLSACATSGPRLWSDEPEPALLYHGSTFELRVREGRVEQVLLPTYPGEPTRVRTVNDIEELRRIYDSTGTPLGPRAGERQIEVNGWVGLQCVRAGEACGAAPTDLPGVMLVLRFE